MERLVDEEINKEINPLVEVATEQEVFLEMEANQEVTASAKVLATHRSTYHGSLLFGKCDGDQPSQLQG